MGSAGLAAAAAGAWWGWQRQASGGDTSPSAPGASGAAAVPDPNVAAQGDPLPAGFWEVHFDTPEGQPFNWSGLQGKPLLLNFWATWCPPCVKEMPELDRFHREFAAAGWQVVGLAIDGPTPVKEFLAKVQVGFGIALAGFGGTELAQTLGNTAGGLPFTVLIDTQGRIRHRKMGATHFDELAAWARSMSPA
jgi:thiol-disulfide isomerase/thioredoxin